MTDRPAKDTIPISNSTRMPLVEELRQSPDIMHTLRAFSDLPGVLLLESALKRGELGRYSFLTADPFEVVTLNSAEYGSDPFARLRQALSEFRTVSVDALPPFQGGAAGLLSYELGNAWERIPLPAADEFKLPTMKVGLYDWVIAWDHSVDRAWIISQGFPETEIDRRVDRAGKRLEWVRDRLENNSPKNVSTEKTESLPIEKLVPQFSAPGLNGLTSDFSREDYLQAVERVIEYIYAGDIFQANLSQRLLYPAAGSEVDLYSRLRERNPAPFAAFVSYDDWAVVSASPERFVCMRGREVETRPIKGTRKRQPGPEADLFSRDELRESDKDQAENVMIVDLLRNDLSRVCNPRSIRVPHLCVVETYETVQHLVSEIRGELSPQNDAWDLFSVLFPGGSITGAPKVRAMQIIAELEPTARGPYCGSLFYVGFDGTVDSNILIRSFTCRRGWIQFPVGGGIVAQSDPLAEYEETLHKAEGMLRALGSG